MALRRFPISYRRGYVTLLFFVNIFTSFTLALLRIGKDVYGLKTEVQIISISLIFIFIIFTCLYAWATMREYRACLGLIKKDAKLYFNRFTIGISCTWLSLLIAFITCAVSFTNGIGDSGLKILGYLALAITIILGIVSNIFIKMFESRIGFDVFRSKYSKTLMQEIAKNLETKGGKRGSYR